jgi:DNA-binding NarL/FixJ family response regulator
MSVEAPVREQSQSTTPGQERPVSPLRLIAEPEIGGAEVSVTVLCADSVIAAGLEKVLHECAGFRIVPGAEPGDYVCDQSPADVVLADYETALRLSECAPQWAKNVVIFTSYDSEAKICRALESGVRGYLLYGVGLQELFEGIRCVREGGVALSPLAVAGITNRVRGEALTPREKAVLGQLMLGLSNKAIARTLNVSVGTVKSHVKGILEKLDAGSRTAAVVTAQRRGLLV